MNNDEKPEAFFNRHGHVMKPKNIESADESAPVVASKQFKTKRPGNKKRLFIILIAIVLILITTWFGYGALIKNNYQNSRAHLKSVVSAQADSIKDLQLKNEVTVEKLEEFHAHIAKASDDSCKPAPFESLVSLHPGLKQSRNSCQSSAQGALDFREVFDLSIDSIVYVNKVNEILKPALAKPKQQFTELNFEKERWSTALKAAQTAQAPGLWPSAHHNLTQQIKKISDLWNKLVDANRNQSANEFTETETQLAEEYQRLRGLARAYQTSIVDEQVRLTQAFSDFNSK